MGRFRFTRLAANDLLNIGDYTLRTWGAAQTTKYLDELESACERLAAAPLTGRACGNIRPGLCRSEVGKHIIFYRPIANEIPVVRILHQQMLPERHLFKDDTDLA